MWPWCADTVATASDVVTQKLKKRRQQIEELARVQALLIKLQVCAALCSVLWVPAQLPPHRPRGVIAACPAGNHVLYVARLQAVFDLPCRLQAALAEGALDGAVAFYAEAQPLLRRYGHKAALREVVAAADAAARDVAAALKTRLAERKDDTEQIVLLLRRLGEADDTLLVRGVPLLSLRPASQLFL